MACGEVRAEGEKGRTAVFIKLEHFYGVAEVEVEGFVGVEDVHLGEGVGLEEVVNGGGGGTGAAG